MGADIHGLIEEKFVYLNGNTHYSSFCELHLGRDYDLFSVLAGVRGWMDPVYEQRGFPKDACYCTLHSAGLYISDSADHINDDIDYNARIIGKNKAKILLEEKPYLHIDDHHMLCPGYHSHSYLYLEELKLCQKQYKKWNGRRRSKDLDMIITIMNQFQKRKITSRFVFWFDS